MTDRSIVATKVATCADLTMYENRVVWIRFHGGTVLDEPLASAHQIEFNEFVGEEPYAAVLDVRRMGYATAAGREASWNGTGDNRVASAIVTHSETMDYVARRFFEEADYEPKTGLFQDLGEALDWAQQHMTGQ